MQKKPKLKERKPMFNMQMKNSIGGANLEVFKFTLVLHLISFLPIHYLLQIQMKLKMKLKHEHFKLNVLNP